jgi:PilZ domain
MIKNRRSRRSPVLLAASLEVAGEMISVKLRNLSEEGALIEGENLPVEGAPTIFCRNDLRLRSRIVWVHGRYAGVAFDAPLNTDEVLRNVPKARSKPQQEFRRPGLACRPITSFERSMLERWMTDSRRDHIGD